jgi:hypothetical protein
MTQSGHQPRLEQTNEWVCIQKKDRRAAVFLNKASIAKA